MRQRDNATVVLLDDDPAFTSVAERMLSADGYCVEAFNEVETFFANLDRLLPDVICLDLHLPERTGLIVLGQIRAINPKLPVVMLTADAQTESIVAAMRAGAYDYLVKPIEREKLLLTVQHAVNQFGMALRLSALEREGMQQPEYCGMRGRSVPMRDLFRQIDRVALSDATVLIRGEVGCGKTLVARAIHAQSARASKAFEVFDCASTAEAWQEPTLLGYERGAFRGATARTTGLIDAAQGGTLLFKEISASSGALQSTLGLLLQRHQFRRAGSPTSLQADVRFLATTHVDLASQVAAGRFREDVYFRLAVVELAVPALRDRRDDIPLLAEAFARQYRGFGHPTSGESMLTQDVVEILAHYDWPGNVVELSNAMQQAVLKAHARPIGANDLPRRVLERSASGMARPKLGASSSDQAATPTSLSAIERQSIQVILEAQRWNLAAAARELGIGRTTLYRKIRQYGLARGRRGKEVRATHTD